MDSAEPSALSPASSALGIQELHLSSRAFWVVTLGAAIALRFALLGQNSLWYDEIFVVRIAGYPWHDVFRVLRAVDAHPPLYFLLMKAWVGIAGTGEAAVRLPSACFSLLSVPFTYVLMRRVSPEPVSLLSAFLVAVAPLQILAGQEARMYPFLEVLALASTITLAASVERGGAIRWAGYTILATLMVYTHYLGFLVLGAHGIWVAGYHRTELWKWLAGMAAAAALYAPWVPSLWDQVVIGRGAWPAYAYSPADLLGLFAFGGVLFGMAGYFATGSLGPIDQAVLLLPFLAVLWRGVASFASNRRSLALLGLPPVVTIGAMLLLSLVRPLFLPRWFSFLYPFYAMFLARGIVDIAGHFRGRREGMLALLTGALLLYSVPILERYYNDPKFRPYHWREAAALVQARARPEDFFLYVNPPAKLAFTYYFRDPHPSRTLPLSETAPTEAHPARFTSAAAQDLAVRHPRMWFIATSPFDGEPRRRIQGALGSVFRVVHGYDFGFVWVYFLEAK